MSASLSEVSIDKNAAAADFAGAMAGHLHGAAVTMMTAVGHRTGLFDAMAQMPPSTSAEVAAAADLDERYVREWLAAMVTARIVELDEQANTYSLPDEHAQSLTRAYGADNLAPLAQFLTTLVKVEDRIVASFQHGKGVQFSEFPRIDQVMGELTGPALTASLNPMLELVPSVVQRLRHGIDVLDLGCGQGRSTLLLAQRFPRSRFKGIDLSETAIAQARREAARLRLQNATFEVQDAAAVEERNAYELVLTFDAIHDQAEPATVVGNIHRALQWGGTYVMVEPDASSHLHENFENPLATYLYTVSTFHCMTVSLAQDGHGLGTMWGRQNATALLRRAGFDDVRVEKVESDRVNAYFIATK